VLFICQDEAQRDDFLTRADRELTGHHWHTTNTADPHRYIGRRHILFCNERHAYLGQPEARRLPPYPAGHPGRRGRDAEVRGVRLPGRARGAKASGPQAEDRAVGTGGRRGSAVEAA
jgi:hypothetical protein